MKTNKMAIIERLTVDPTNINIKYWQEVGTVQVMLLPLSAERSQIARAEGIIGKAYQIYAGLGADIQETDRLVVDTTEYEVRGIKKYEGSHNVDHIEVLIEERKT